MFHTDKDTRKKIPLWESNHILPIEVCELSAHFRQIVGWSDTARDRIKCQEGLQYECFGGMVKVHHREESETSQRRESCTKEDYMAIEEAEEGDIELAEDESEAENSAR